VFLKVFDLNGNLFFSFIFVRVRRFFSKKRLRKISEARNKKTAERFLMLVRFLIFSAKIEQQIPTIV